MGEGGGDKRDKLLALFGKTAATTSPVPTAPTVTKVHDAAAGKEDKPPVLKYEGGEGASQQQQPKALASDPPKLHYANGIGKNESLPPSKPLIRPSPSSRPPSSSNTASLPPTSTRLLNLFTSSAAPLKSPGSGSTPISPFTLGTPMSHSPSNSVGENAGGAARSRLNSVVDANGVGGRKGSTTPVEAKGFLRGYLEGVVRAEGKR